MGTIVNLLNSRLKSITVGCTSSGQSSKPIPLKSKIPSLWCLNLSPRTCLGSLAWGTGREGDDCVAEVRKELEGEEEEMEGIEVECTTFVSSEEELLVFFSISNGSSVILRKWEGSDISKESDFDFSWDFITESEDPFFFGGKEGGVIFESWSDGLIVLREFFLVGVWVDKELFDKGGFEGILIEVGFDRTFVVVGAGFDGAFVVDEGGFEGILVVDGGAFIEVLLMGGLGLVLVSEAGGEIPFGGLESVLISS